MGDTTPCSKSLQGPYKSVDASSDRAYIPHVHCTKCSVQLAYCLKVFIQ